MTTQQLEKNPELETEIQTEDRPNETALRPQKMTEFIGQENIRDNLLVFIESARSRSDAMDHVLLFGPPVNMFMPSEFKKPSGISSPIQAIQQSFRNSTCVVSLGRPCASFVRSRRRRMDRGGGDLDA